MGQARGGQVTLIAEVGTLAMPRLRTPPCHPILFTMKGATHQRKRPPRNRDTGWRLGSRKPRCRNARATPGLRFYTPELGRWVSRDPVEEWGGIALLTFLLNAPVVTFDALGFEPSGGEPTVEKDDDPCTCRGIGRKQATKVRKQFLSEDWVQDIIAHDPDRNIWYFQPERNANRQDCRFRFEEECAGGPGLEGKYVVPDRGQYHGIIRIYFDNLKTDDAAKRALRHELQHAWERCNGSDTPFFPPTPYTPRDITCGECLCIEMNAYMCGGSPECTKGKIEPCMAKAVESCTDFCSKKDVNTPQWLKAMGAHVRRSCPKWRDTGTCWAKKTH